MIIAKVLGNVVATQRTTATKARGDDVRTDDARRRADWSHDLALDAVDAGVGDTVLVVQEGWSASTAATGKAGAAIDTAIVGVIDHIDLLKE